MRSSIARPISVPSLTREAHIVAEIRATCCRGQNRLFRNNVGVAVYPDGARVEYGLVAGSSDLIGWSSVVVTPEMVGQRVAIFTAIEVKKPGSYATPAQKNFIRIAREAGGYAGIARSVQDAESVQRGEATGPA